LNTFTEKVLELGSNIGIDYEDLLFFPRLIQNVLSVRLQRITDRPQCLLPLHHFDHCPGSNLCLNTIPHRASCHEKGLCLEVVRTLPRNFSLNGDRGRSLNIWLIS
jgi:hypothetical protein